MKKATDTIGTLAEAYITVTALLGISLFTLFQVQTILTRSSQGLNNVFLFSLVVVPILSVVFIWMLDGVQPKQPYTDYRPYKIFLASLPLGVLIYLLPLPTKTFLHVSLALIASVAAPALFSVRYSRERMGLERRLPDFIRDIAEGRKIGLPPEGNIERLGDKNYGRLSKYVKRMGSQLSWGISMNKVMSAFSSEVKSWLTKVVAKLMLEVVDVGGGTVKSFSDMADFTRKIDDIETEKRSALRPYVFVIYMAGIMVVATTLLMIYLLAQPAALGAVAAGAAVTSPDTIDLLFTASIFEGWVVGIVAGKMGESSVSDGFKHALVLVIISVATIYIGRLFIAFPI